MFHFGKMSEKLVINKFRYFIVDVRLNIVLVMPIYDYSNSYKDILIVKIIRYCVTNNS